MKINILNVGENHGDCFFIELYNKSGKTVIMVDGRKGDNSSFLSLKGRIKRYEAIDYIVLTHVDDDHIHGLLKTFRDEELRPYIKNSIIIYNYVSSAVVSYKQAEEFEELIKENTVISTTMRNYTEYSSECLKLMSYEMRKELEPDKTKEYAVMTLLHPDRQGVKEVYKDYCQWKKGKSADNPLINKNSIAFLLEYKDYKMLFTGDGEMSVLIPKIESLKNMKDREVDFIKIAHHGAGHNNEGLIPFSDKHKCYKFMVTGKKEWDLLHPNEKLVDELIKIDPSKVEIYTNVDISKRFKDVSNIKEADTIITITKDEVRG